MAQWSPPPALQKKRKIFNTVNTTLNYPLVYTSRMLVYFLCVLSVPIMASSITLSTLQTCFWTIGYRQGHCQVSLEAICRQGCNFSTDRYCLTQNIFIHRHSCLFHLNYNTSNCEFTRKASKLLMISHSLYLLLTVIIQDCCNDRGRCPKSDWWTCWIYGHSEVMITLCCHIISGAYHNIHCAINQGSSRKCHSEWRRFSVVLSCCKIKIYTSFHSMQYTL